MSSSHRSWCAIRATFAGISLLSALAGPARADADLSAADALLPVNAVTFRQDLERGRVVTGISTSFGVTPVRPAEYVARQFDWKSQRATMRAPRSLYDLDFSTTIDTDPEDAQPVEAAIILNSGTARLAPGPDVFVFLKTNAVSGVRVAPLLHDAHGMLSKGPEVELNSAFLTPILFGDQKVYGFAIDLNMWVEHGLTPAHGDIMGVVVSHDGAPGTGALTLAEIVASDAVLFSTGAGGGGGGSESIAFALGSGFRGAGSGGGGGSGNPQPDNHDLEEEIPAPGAGIIVGLGLAATVSRRRRR